MLINDYANKIEKELDARGGKLLLTDTDKGFAVSAISTIAQKRDSALFIVLDGEVAADCASVLGEDGATVISSYDDFAGRMSDIGANKIEKLSDKQLDGYKAEFKNKFRRVIVAAFDAKGEPVLNRRIADVSDKSGIYSSANGSAAYCISDFLAACGYEFAFADGVYRLFDFKKCDLARLIDSEPDDERLNPLLYESIGFMGKWYVTDRAHSYARLKKICSSAQTCVLLSDVIAYRNALELFCACELLCDYFPTEAARKTLRGLSQDYEADLMSVVSDLGFCITEDSFISMMLTKLRDSAQVSPTTTEDLTAHLRVAFRYMSQEQFFLRVMKAYIDRRFNGRVPDFDTALVDLCDNDEYSSQSFVDVLFSNALQGEFEKKLGAELVCKMSDDDVRTLFDIFGRYGICEGFRYDCDAVDTIRIMRDDSGYEAFIENHASFVQNNGDAGAPEVDETAYSVIHGGSDLLYECATLAQICTDPSAPRKAEFPVLLVADDDKTTIKRMLEKYLDAAECTEDFSQASTATGNEIIITDFARLEKCARPLNVKSVVYFGSPANPQKLLALINKTGAYGGARNIIVTRYGDLSARISAQWNHVIERKSNFPLPLGMDEIEMSGAECEDYESAIKRIEDVYVGLRELACDASKRDVGRVAKLYNRLRIDYSSCLPEDLQGIQDPGTIEKDFDYLSKVAESYNGIFKHSSSVGRRGDVTRVSKDDLFCDKEPERLLFFDVCAKMLRRKCDVCQNDCGDCDEYEKNKKNDFSLFADSVDKFFETSADYARERDAERERIKSKQIVLGNSEQNDSTLLTEKTVCDAQKEVKTAMSKLKKTASKYDGVFAVEYGDVESIRNVITALYARSLERYYNRIIAIFDNINERVRLRTETILDDGNRSA